MKTLIVGLGFAALVSAPAVAADIPVKAPPMAAVYSWTGLYIGGTFGYNNGDLHWSFINPANSPTPNPLELSGWNGGGFVGMQWQAGNFVLGVEANGFWSDLKGWSICPTTTFRCEASLDDLWTVGGRLGYVWGGAGQYMTFVSGGWASAKVTSDTITISSGALFDTGNARHDGWYLGGGFDFRLVGDWIAGFEYRHYQLESATHVAVPALTTEDRLIKPEWDSFQFRLSYKFGWIGR
jgi:outer membrane immunogenic protein